MHFPLACVSPQGFVTTKKKPPKKRCFNKRVHPSSGAPLHNEAVKRTRMREEKTVLPLMALLSDLFCLLPCFTLHCYSDTLPLHRSSQQGLQKTMSKEEQHADSTLSEKAKRRQPSADEVLVEAARNGDTAAVRAGLEKLSPDADSKTVTFDAVHEACRGNHDECLTLLLPYVETTQMGFGILLSECIHADHTACTEVLLQHWKSVCSNVAFVPLRSKGQKGDWPAMWSDPAVCEVLIGAGADIETKGDMGRTPLHYACESGELAVVKMLVKAGARVRATDHGWLTCLMLASSGSGNTETVRYLVGLPQVDVRYRHSLDRCSALHIAVRKDAAIVQVLIDAGADIEAKTALEKSPLYWACFSGELGVVETLLRAGAGVQSTDTKGNTCLMLASICGHTEIVRTLLCMPEVQLDQPDYNGRTALHHAATKKHADVVQVLIDAGADIEAKTRLDRSSLHKASGSGGLDIVKMLVSAGADVRAINSDGHTCLFTASFQGHTDIVRYLVGLPEVEVNHRGTSGHTALYYARQKGHVDVVQVLLEHGAEVLS